MSGEKDMYEFIVYARLLKLYKLVSSHRHRIKDQRSKTRIVYPRIGEMMFPRRETQGNVYLSPEVSRWGNMMFSHRETSGKHDVSRIFHERETSGDRAVSDNRSIQNYLVLLDSRKQGLNFDI